ncbi:A/G-specific adenine glycosylase [Thioclava sp. F1Mire-8]|uniref:A/G-specific adenine glycosylase n=1 Tax=Thioclava sp. F1Mire-8 TaxID=1973006 RepID=UPI000B540D81|nr:A/G-specific adenine glycosylase [Thioclava sp. F1Mire-8]OWY02641.1 A/G-specific adenine glycosylase [Thioclava sp. F1Mire-8]
MRDGKEAIGETLLNWYDTHARVMPWRVSPADRAEGERPDPYRVWLSEVMLQQTTVAAVRDYFRRFTERWPDVGALAAAEEGDVMAEWAGLGYYARARNLLKCARVVADDMDGRFPESAAELQKLPGIGPYTSAAIAAIAYDEPVAVVDGNVERVVSRLFSVDTPLPGAKSELTDLTAQITPEDRPGDFAQAMMDLGATICTPRNPACGICPLIDSCTARAAGIAETLPRKAPKKEKPTRRGFAYVVMNAQGDVLLERRPDKGLLGGTLGFPGSDWSDAPTPAPPVQADWILSPVEVRHTFTHFHLILQVHVARKETESMTSRTDFRPGDLPTLMRKVWDAAQSADGSQAE